MSGNDVPKKTSPWHPSSYPQIMIGVFNPLLSIVFRFHETTLSRCLMVFGSQLYLTPTIGNSKSRILISVFHWNFRESKYQVIQSDIFIPYLEVTYLLKGHVCSPSQKGHHRRIAKYTSYWIDKNDFLQRVSPWKDHLGTFHLPIFVFDKLPIHMGVNPKIGAPQNGWFIMETLLKWMIWGVFPLFLETPIYNIPSGSLTWRNSPKHLSVMFVRKRPDFDLLDQN